MWYKLAQEGNLIFLRLGDVSDSGDDADVSSNLASGDEDGIEIS
ncbi:hypothetical protein [Mesorhizobium tamadayense]|nr:hypothetical protein [Mesorhizobium tamadayense]